MMTLDKMKLVVCTKLPDLTEIDILNNGEHVIRWRDDRPISWPTEGLQVCHEAEKVLGDSHTYASILGKICMPHYAIRATYEQRLEALCRVWWPERF